MGIASTAEPTVVTVNRSRLEVTIGGVSKRLKADGKTWAAWETLIARHLAAPGEPIGADVIVSLVWPNGTRDGTDTDGRALGRTIRHLRRTLRLREIVRDEGRSPVGRLYMLAPTVE